MRKTHSKKPLFCPNMKISPDHPLTPRQARPLLVDGADPTVARLLHPSSLADGLGVSRSWPLPRTATMPTPFQGSPPGPCSSQLSVEVFPRKESLKLAGCFRWARWTASHTGLASCWRVVELVSMAM